jgi:hypothetical protein
LNHLCAILHRELYHRRSRRSGLACVLLLSACAVEDSHLAELVRSRLLGIAEVELESCIGAPDQHSTFGDTDVLTYYASSTNYINWTIPIVGGFSANNGGYCHATFQIVNNRVVRVLYSGEKNAPLAPDAFCAPIIRTCLANIDDVQYGTAVASAPAASPVDRSGTGAASSLDPVR